MPLSSRCAPSRSTLVMGCGASGSAAAASDIPPKTRSCRGRERVLARRTNRGERRVASPQLSEWPAREPRERPLRDVEKRRITRAFLDGRGWFRTSDLSRVKRGRGRRRAARIPRVHRGSGPSSRRARRAEGCSSIAAVAARLRRVAAQVRTVAAWSVTRAAKVWGDALAEAHRCGHSRRGALRGQADAARRRRPLASTSPAISRRTTRRAQSASPRGSAARSLMAAAISRCRNSYAAAALLRQVVEVEYLLWTFADDPEDTVRWLNASKSQLDGRFRPAAMRQRSAGHFRTSEYVAHSTRADIERRRMDTRGGSPARGHQALGSTARMRRRSWRERLGAGSVLRQAVAPKRVRDRTRHSGRSVPANDSARRHRMREDITVEHGAPRPTDRRRVATPSSPPFRRARPRCAPDWRSRPPAQPPYAVAPSGRASHADPHEPYDVPTGEPSGA